MISSSANDARALQLVIRKLARNLVRTGTSVEALARALKIEAADLTVNRMGFTLDQSASRLGVSKNTIRNWIEEGTRNAQLGVAQQSTEIVFEFLMQRTNSGAPGAAISQIHRRVTESRRKQFDDKLNQEMIRMKSKHATDAELESYRDKMIEALL